MENHVHLLLHDDRDQLDLIMKKVAGSYAYYFNHKYDRSGHLFQDRYGSEAIEDDAYLLTVIRYIHRNPDKGGDCQSQGLSLEQLQRLYEAARGGGQCLGTGVDRRVRTV